MLGTFYLNYFLNSRHSKLYVLQVNTKGKGQVYNYIPLTYAEKGKKVVLEAKPEEGYYFAEWILDHESLGNQTKIEITLDTNHTITVVFKQKPRDRAVIIYILSDRRVTVFNN